MNKTKIVFSAPIQSQSGYGARSRDLIRSLIKTERYDIQILPTKWGTTPLTALTENDTDLIERIIANLSEKPEVWVQITVPNEFQPIGNINIGITAGIETDLCPMDWIEGCNRMNHIFVSSEHSKKVFIDTEVERRDNNNNIVSVTRLNRDITVLFEAIDTNTYGTDKVDYNASKRVENDLKIVETKRNLLVVGHWLPGTITEDRKNISGTIIAFAKAFEKKKVGLILKSTIGGFSILEAEAMKQKIRESVLASGVDIENLNIYLIHDEYSDLEMNALYNSSKVSGMVSLTKGEGWGRPLAEFCTTGKPIIVSKWSGHLDFLNPNYNLLINGEMKNVHPSASNKFLLKESRWFNANLEEASNKMLNLMENPKKFLDFSKNNINFVGKFNMENMSNEFITVLDKYLDNVPKKISLKLPKLS